MDALIDLFAQAQQAMFEGLLQPAMFRLGLGNLLAEGYRATGWLLVALLQIGVMLTLMRALERWRPFEPVTDLAAVRTDMLYTLIHRLGLFRVLLFFSVDPFWDWSIGQLRLLGLAGFELDRLWPGITDVAVVSFLLYLLMFDLVDYAYHRLQHGVGWWWQLHAVHHSQRQMTLWSDNRNHLLDDLLRDSVFVLLALVVGVAPGQFVALFPVWDRLFGPARFDAPVQATGIRDQLEGRDYGRGFWAQQWLGLKRLAGRALAACRSAGVACLPGLSSPPHEIAARLLLARRRLLPASQGDRLVAAAAADRRRADAGAGLVLLGSRGGRRACHAGRLVAGGCRADVGRVADGQLVPLGAGTTDRGGAGRTGDRGAVGAAGGLADDAGHRQPGGHAALSGAAAQAGRRLVHQHQLVADLHRAGVAGAGDQRAAVVHPAAGAGGAAADLGLAQLPRDELRRAGRARQR